MRQSGLTPQSIRRLKLKNLEPDTIIPRRIETEHKSGKRTDKRPPYFIGGEANNYLRQYLRTREELTPESLLFTARNNPNKQINTKNASRTFREAIEEIEKERRNEMKSIYAGRFGKRDFSLFSLIEFYREKTKHYRSELEKNLNENGEFYRTLYKEKAMPFLEIESQITIKVLTKKSYQREIGKRDAKIQEMTQTIARDSEYISSILTLLYNNKGDPDTGENIDIGDNFIKLWKETRDKQLKNLWDSWQSDFKIALFPFKDIIEELTATLKRIKKPYDELERQTAN